MTGKAKVIYKYMVQIKLSSISFVAMLLLHGCECQMVMSMQYAGLHLIS